MARPLRLEYPGALYHVTSRGNARQRIFRDDHDRETFLDILAQVIKRFGWLCHGYCLMDNHYHLLIETPLANLAAGMRQLNGLYTQRYNLRHRTVGHVFQGRYKAIVVEKDSHLLELCRYVVLNPVAAGVVAVPGEWKWSSYGATGLSRRAPEWLCTDWVLSQFGRGRSEAQERYREFVREGMGKKPVWDGLVGQIFLGGEEFVAKCRNRIGGREGLEEVPRAQRQVGRPTLSELWAKDEVKDKASRDRLIYQACVDHGYRLKDVAEFLGVHYTTVSKAVRRAEDKK